MLDVLLKNGRYPDFCKNEMVQTNIGIENGKVKYIGMDEPQSTMVINCKDRIVSPGFIDIHMHEEDFNIQEDYIIAKYMLKQGVTTCVGGNCGTLYQTVGEFKRRILEYKGAPVNYAMLSGYNAYRGKLGLGLGHWSRTTEEHRAYIYEKVNEDISEGAFGLSFGIEYDPGISFEEIIDAANSLNGEDLLVAAHYRSDCIGNVDSIREMIEIQNHISQKFQISHLSSCSAMGQMKSSLELINKAIEKDSRLNFDTYPYNAFCTEIGSTVFDEGCLNSWNKGYGDLLLTEDPYKNRRANKEIFDDSRKNHPNMLVVAFVMNEEEIAEAISNKYGIIASDGILKGGNGHPRAAGTFPRVLGKYVRKEKKIELITALKKMTLEPAKRLGIEKIKGDIHIGADADIIVFNPNEIDDGPEYTDLDIPNKGIDYVIINGKIALKNNMIVNDRLGIYISKEAGYGQ